MSYLFKLVHRLARGWALPGIATMLVACAGDAASPVAVSESASVRYSSAVASIQISPSSASGSLGQSAQFSATTYDSRGRVVSGKTVTWISTDSAVVSVTASGFATGIGVGRANITAAVDGISAQAPVSVSGDAIASITLDPTSAGGTVGQSAQFTATVRDSAGTVLSGRRVIWTSSAPSVVSVDTTGFATALAAGSAAITATSAGITAMAPATVTSTTVTAPTVASVVVSPSSASGSVGQSAQFSATACDANGNVLTGQTVTWSTTNAAVVTVTSSGYATAVGGGTASLVATAGGHTGTSAITVTGGTTSDTGGTATSSSVSPSSASIVVGGTQQLVASATDLLGNLVGGLLTTWSSSNPSIASVSTSGMVTGVAAGAATITANTAGLIATSAVNVASQGGGTSGGLWPNAPGSFTPITDQPFDAFPSLGWGLGSGTVSTTTDGSAPASAPNVLQFTYPAGMAGGSAPGTVFHGLASGTRHIYSAFWFKTNANWQGHISNVNKLSFIFTSGSGGNNYICFYGPPGGPYQLRVSVQFPGVDVRWLVPNVANPTVTMGQWHRVEWQMDYGTAGQPNGSQRFWLDGQLVGDYHDITYPTDPLTEFQLSPTWGGVTDVKTQTDYIWFDHVYVSGY